MCDIINQSQQQTLCLTLSEFNKIRLQEYTMAAVQERQSISLVFMIINVSIDALLGTFMASNKLIRGNHWVVVSYDLNAKASFYCDPLRYPVPSDLMVETQQTHNCLEGLLGKHTGMSFPMVAMHKAKFDINGKHAC